MCTKALCFLLRKREFGGDVAVFYNAVVIPKSKNMVKSMADFSDYPVILFAMFHRGSISDPSGVDMAPCRSGVEGITCFGTSYRFSYKLR